ncbi:MULTISPECIES: RCC1 domain-containing protein [unclassified Streptomyces]|uniref:RCC1-like domain-containing protein n=1 Tax=unclassified Streptomyces TaxID=2593676 RepID=UPI0006FF20D5|nr:MULTISPECIES: RCC1 domain-containing protein [unclassified Streptomyces]KQX56140.1 sialidase [Streptomyces sp. Root1304]KRA96956.1 sialidase [Streptomyces sp. Root66D1]
MSRSRPVPPRPGRRARPFLAAVLTAAALTTLPALAPAATAATANEGNPTVLSWGAGRTGQLGNGTLADSLSPTSVTSLFRGDVDQMSAGGTSSADSFALARTDKTVKSWGHNSSGQLGNGGNTNQTVPTTVPRLANIKDIAAGGKHALALDTGGQVYSWGDNSYGQLGNNRTGDSRTVPDRVQGMPKVKQISAGCDFSLALLENGKVYAWGRGIHGQLGTGTRATSSVPRQVVGLENVVEIDAGCYHALALTSDDTVKSWGYNLYGQLGNSSTKSSTLPVDVDWVEGVSDIEAGAFHNYVKTSDSHVWGWGNNQYGQLLESDEAFDSNVSRTNRTAPVEIPRLEGVQHLAAGARHGVAVTADDVFAWGNNSEGQLGNGTTVSRYESVKILNEGSAIKNVAVSLGGNTTYAY